MQYRLAAMEGVTPILRGPLEGYVGSSIQFTLAQCTHEQIAAFIAGCEARGLPVKWYGKPLPEDYTSRYDSWAYLGSHRAVPNADRVLATLCDLRLPLTFELADCDDIATLIQEALTDTREASSVA
jgi:hypothetical protein